MPIEADILETQRTSIVVDDSQNGQNQHAIPVENQLRKRCPCCVDGNLKNLQHLLLNQVGTFW